MQVLLLIFQHDTSVLIPGNMSVFIYIINIHVVTIIHSCTVYIYIYIYINYYTFLWSGYCHVAFGADQSTQFPPFHGLTLL